VILGLSRPPSFARLLMLVRKGQILDAATAGRLQPGDYAYFLVSRDRLARLDSLFRESADVARRLGLEFGELPIRGETPIREIASFYGLDFGPGDPDQPIADWLADRAGGPPVLDAATPIAGGRLIVRRIESGRIATVGLHLDALDEVDPEEALIESLALEVEAEARGPLARWLARLRGRGAGAAPGD
jgi:cell volume regulation protein A